MNFEQIQEKVKNNMSDFRYQHSLRVSKYADELAEKHGYDVEKAKLAGMVHDYAKEVPAETFLEYIDKYNLDPELKKWLPAIWHGIVGSYIIKDELGIEDPEILHAVKVHTTGSIEMNTLDKIVFLADWLEPGREFDDDLNNIKRISEENLDYGVKQELSFAIKHVASKDKAIYPETLYAYNYWVGGIK